MGVLYIRVPLFSGCKHTPLPSDVAGIMRHRRARVWGEINDYEILIQQFCGESYKNSTLVLRFAFVVSFSG